MTIKPITAILETEVLSDGSGVYNVVITDPVNEQRIVLPAEDERSAQELVTMLTNFCVVAL